MRTIVTPWSKFTLILVAPFEAAVLSLLHIFLEFPFLYQLFYLLFQVPTILRVMAMILVETTILVLITDVG